MGQGGDQTRTNLSMTIFLSDPASYDGASFILEMPFGEQEIEMGSRAAYTINGSHNNLPHYAIEL